ncbi:hypothetical protein [Desulfospira joergensenii]|uniref:hypothetical protein n=1 Tax=Desulfospira joergensenii TaxID=53329 RepID=UPI0003B67B3E|nr:hypothetical protein [Desulfospira joergensenii]
MNGPMTNFESGKMQHKEHEAWAARRRAGAKNRKPAPVLSKVYKLVLSIIGAGAGISYLLAFLNGL